jgi:spermidine/putrescine transport system substrate-binding protein
MGHRRLEAQRRNRISNISRRNRALGWIDTFAIPAKGRADDATYRWINFNMRPDIAARVAASAGNFSASTAPTS